MELAELLATLAADGAVAGLTDEDLIAHEATLTAAVDAVDLSNPSAEDLTTLTAISSAVEAVRTEANTRHEAAEARATEAAELVARIRPVEPVAEGDTPDEDTETEDAPAEAPADPPPAPAPAPETQVVVNAEAPAPAPVAVAPEPVAEPVAVAASARHTVPAEPTRPLTPLPPMPNLGRAQRRAGAQHRPVTAARSPFTITASADVGGYSGGQHISTDQLDRILAEKLDAFGERPGSMPGPKLKVATVYTDYDEAHTFDAHDGPANEAKAKALVASMKAAQSLTASGGPCAAPTVDYSLNPIGSADRMLPGALVQVNAPRGAVMYQQPPKIGAYAAGVGVWTQANDITPGSDGPATKPCVTITCGSYVTARTEAITVCATIGNFISRNDPEAVEALRKLLAIEASRKIESRHLTAMGAASSKKPKTKVLGTARDVLARIIQQIAQAEDQYRMGDGETFEFVAPRLLGDMMRVDLIRELPGSTAERLRTADAEINAMFVAAGVNVTWVMDGENGAIFPAEVDGTATRWPTTVRTLLYPTGSWKLMDDGRLDLSVSGPYHDSVLNQTNNAQIWWEEFQNVYFQGTWTRALDLEVCSSGATSATTAVACLTGS